MKVFETVKIQKDVNVLWIILNRTKQLNAMNDLLLRDFIQVLDEVEKDENVRCVVIAGEGERAFSAGADVSLLANMTRVKAEEFSRLGQNACMRLEGLSKPTIASISGFALGGGLELALACDIRVAAENAVLGCTEVILGLIPAWGGTQRLARVVGLAKANEMILLGLKIKADEALRIGLVHKVVPSLKLQEEVRMLALKFCDLPPISLKYAKQALNFGAQASLEEVHRLEARLMGLLSATEDFKEGIDAFKSHRKAEFKGK